MKQVRTIIALVTIIIQVSLNSCIGDPIILHGDISGYVKDQQTSQSIPQTDILLAPSGDTATTDSAGFYLINNIRPNNYEIRASKHSYADQTKFIEVKTENVVNVDFNLTGIPVMEISDTLLDFGLDTDIKYFTVRNIGKATLYYEITKFQDWITISPTEGNVTNETDTIIVTIDREGISESKYETNIIVTQVGEGSRQIDLKTNGVLWDGYYYGTVTIGSQTWMAENLNSGVYTEFHPNILPKNDDIVQKYCFDNTTANCKKYGGLYTWQEMMDYAPPDTGLVGITQGICPDGWHIPTESEWITLFEFLGGSKIDIYQYSEAGGALKDTGNIRDGTGYWAYPNSGATNESGFSAFPTGSINNIGTIELQFSFNLETNGNYWIAQTWDDVYDGEIHGAYYILVYDLVSVFTGNDFEKTGCAAAVRCILDP